MNVSNTNSIKRYPNSTSLTHLAIATRAVETGFMAAGITVAVVAVAQSVIIVLSWIASGG
jgi:hypothetical protein